LAHRRQTSPAPGHVGGPFSGIASQHVWAAEPRASRVGGSHCLFARQQSGRTGPTSPPVGGAARSQRAAAGPGGSGRGVAGAQHAPQDRGVWPPATAETLTAIAASILGMGVIHGADVLLHVTGGGALSGLSLPPAVEPDRGNAGEGPPEAC
jgi:hypothetical protein